MIEISRQYVADRLPGRFARLAGHIRNGIRWWAEHQAWPAHDAIRIDDDTAASRPRGAYFR